MHAIPAGCDLELRPVRPEDAETLFWRSGAKPGAAAAMAAMGDGGIWPGRYAAFPAGQGGGELRRAVSTTGIWAGGTLCGAIGLHPFDERHRSSSIGYWVDCGHEGRGIVTHACRAIVSEGFSEYGLHRIEIRCATGNDRSAAIAKRLGFIHEGVLREAEWLHDHWVDLNVFGMLQNVWAA